MHNIAKLGTLGAAGAVLSLLSPQVSSQPRGAFLIFPLKGTTPSESNRYTDGAYTPGRMNSILDHSMVPNTAGVHQYGTADGRVVAFNGETASGRSLPVDRRRGIRADATCVGGTINLRPSAGKGPMTNTSGCQNVSGYASYDEHPGYDYMAATGTPVYAAASGTVINRGGQRCIDSNLGHTCDAWGFVGIDHGNGYITQYGHLNTIDVRAGSTINRGQKIGTVGGKAPNKTLGAHLHFEVLFRSRDRYYVVDPYGWVGSSADPLYSRSVSPPRNLWL